MRRHPHLIEISTFPWLERLSREDGRPRTLADVPPSEWDALRSSGFDLVYLMGVWRRSPLGRQIARTDLSLLDAYDRALPGWSMKDVAGSPYCVQAYEPDDRVGGWRGVDRAREELARRGIGLVLDFVPNHTALDHEWLQTRPELYVTGTLDDHRRHPGLFHPVDDADGVRFVACAKDPYFPPWRDVAQLNHYNPATREALIDTLARVADHCDGVRCDMAMLVLNDVVERTWGHMVDLVWPRPADEFWPAAIARVRSLLYLAEVYWDREYTLQQQGFDFTYDKRLLDRLRFASAAEVRAHLRADPEYAAKLARFLENHDEERSSSAFGPKLPAAAAVAFTVPGLRFFFDGQTSGAATRSPVQLGRWPEGDVNPDVRAFYARLLPVLDRELLHDGTWMPLETRGCGDGTEAALVASAWRRAGELAVIAANLSSDTAQGLLQLGPLPPGRAFEFRDQLADRHYRWTRDDLRDGLYVRLPANGVHLFLVDADANT
jgi:alpha amylase-like protein